MPYPLNLFTDYISLCWDTIGGMEVFNFGFTVREFILASIGFDAVLIILGRIFDSKPKEGKS